MTQQLSPAGHLCDVLVRENAALAAFDLSSAAALLARKQEAVNAFAAAPASPDGDPALARLQALAAENRRLLEHAITVQRQVIAVIAATLPPAAGPRYAASGAPARGQPTALTFAARV